MTEQPHSGAGSAAESADLAPLIPLFGHRERTADDVAVAQETPSWHPAWVVDPLERAEDEAVETAERALIKRLRTRQLSCREARGFLSEQEIAEDAIDRIMDVCVARGYLDDMRLAEQILHVGLDRKKQGRRAISQAMTARGLPRDVVDEAMTVLDEDDELERAQEFARTKARSLQNVERDAALRRLMGQLARRGFSGAVVGTAARAALDELTSPRKVRFLES
ncbi:regulatory protein RecX [Microbacterium sp. NPDC077184]|uniref:regulatory protein RecX n=1 Tax=Microbacterium sp. NPDC077184 TaxID=3154764 RepID=UPI003441B288